MLTALIVFAGVVAAIAAWLLSRETVRARDWVIAAALVVWVGAVGTKVYTDRSPSAGAATAGADVTFRLPEWAAPGEAALEGTADATPSGVGAAAPVADLIGGLEARLTASPNDAQGWALLAQSYAFVGDAEGAERALERAVALGFDERTLRERVNAARREPEAHSWIDRTVGG